jgi:hypothetical protein
MPELRFTSHVANCLVNSTLSLSVEHHPSFLCRIVQFPNLPLKPNTRHHLSNFPFAVESTSKIFHFHCLNHNLSFTLTNSTVHFEFHHLRSQSFNSSRYFTLKFTREEDNLLRDLVKHFRPADSSTISISLRIRNPLQYRECW